MNEVERILQQRGRERRALGEALRPCVNLPDATFEHGPGCECGKAAALRDSLRERPHTASRAEPDDALQHDAPIGERDLAYALEEALMVDGDRRRAFAVLIMWREQQHD